MTYTFEDAAPIKIQGTGRKAADNPFWAVIESIALKTTEVNGKVQPVAKAFVEEHEAGNRDKVIKRIKAQMSAAGAVNEPAVTVYVNGEAVKETVKGKEIESDTKTRITFWTVKRQNRPRKDKVEGTATATTEQSTAVATA